MEQKICLDTDICIEIINDTSLGKEAIEKIKDFQIFISTISIFELYLRESNIDKIDFFINKFFILPFDDSCAVKSSEMTKELKKKGKIIDFRDIFIAATCVINNCSFITLNRKHFENINELKLLKM